MTTYTITVASDGGQFGGYYGYYDGTLFGGTAFGAISPGGSGLNVFVWLPDGSDVQIGSNTLPDGSVVTWNGQNYTLSDLGGGIVGYASVGLGGPYLTTGTTDIETGSSPTITGVMDASVPAVTSNFSGQVIISGTMDASIPVGAAFTGYDIITGTMSAAISVIAAQRGYVLPNGAGVVALASGTTWTVPADWNNADNSVACIGAGGNSSITSLFTGGAGGGGGAGAQSSNLTFTIGDVVDIRVGPGIDTVFGGTTLGSCLVGAQRGSNASGSTGGAGGLASASVGAIKYDGGTGGNGGTESIVIPVYGSGGGAGGPYGVGGNGATSTTGSISTGGSGDGGTGGAGGSIGNPDGGSGTELSGVGSGGGGGGPNGYPGWFGAGGGGGSTSVRPGAPGLIVIRYTPKSLARSFGFIIG